MEITAIIFVEILANQLEDVSLVLGSEVILDQLGEYVAVINTNMINEAVCANMLCEVSST